MRCAARHPRATHRRTHAVRRPPPARPDARQPTACLGAPPTSPVPARSAIRAAQPDATFYVAADSAEAYDATRAEFGAAA
eukprot:5425379-Prymnesium_polylepis.1